MMIVASLPVSIPLTEEDYDYDAILVHYSCTSVILLRDIPFISYISAIQW